MLLILSLAFLPMCVSAQECTPIFDKAYYGTGNDEALDIGVTSDGGSIVAGRTSTNSSLWDGFLLRLNSSGDILWAKSFGGSQYDELSKVKQTKDGGFVAIGTTNSFGSVEEEAWMIKTDANGSLLWTRQINKDGKRTKSKRVIQLSNGDYVVALNINDSTAAGDGLIIRLNGIGNPIWQKTFDNGGDDGINSLFQDGNSLLVGGYATVVDREGILMRIDIATATVTWAKKFSWQDGQSDEIVHVEKIDGGLAFGASTTWTRSDNGFNPYDLTFFKTRGDDSVYFQRQVYVPTGSESVIKKLEMRSTADSGFIYAVNDTTERGFGAFRKLSPSGSPDWGREKNEYRNRWINGLDLVNDNGYLLAGHYNDNSTGYKSRIQVLKTDIIGSTGACTGPISGSPTDTTSYRIAPFTWSRISNGITLGLFSPDIMPLNLKTETFCADTYCGNPDVSADTTCFATMLTHIKGKYNFVPYDFVKVADGYLLAGFKWLFWNMEGMLIKVRRDGTVAWTKTMADFMHEQTFDRIFLTGDGNVLVTGKDNYTVDHVGFSGGHLMKITSAGEVLWAKYINGHIYDMKPDGNGGFIGTITENYGFPPIYIKLFKMDASGNITWQKKMNKEFDFHPMYRKIVQDGTFTYASGEFYNQNDGQNIIIEKLDEQGDPVWSKVFRVNGFATSVESLDIIGDSVYVLASFFDNTGNPFYGKKKLATVKIGKDGSGLNGFSLENLDLIPDPRMMFYYAPFQIAAKTLDNNFIVADRAKAISDSSLVITKFSPTGVIIWSRRYDNLKSHFISSIKEDNGSFLFLGRKGNGFQDLTHLYETMLMRTDQNGNIIDNAGSACYSSLHSPYTKPVTFTAGFFNPTIRSEGDITTAPHPFLTRPFTFNSERSCATISACSALTIQGPRKVCHSSDTIAFSIVRSPGCTSPPLWKYDPQKLKVVSQNDTTLRVLFLSPGNTIISATLISGCGEISDTIAVTVPASGGVLNLGPDSTLCPGNSILLNARSGYASYLWQDGSSDSVFIVRQPGAYNVMVIDSCGRESRDTVLIGARPPIPFEVSSDRTKCNNDTLQFNAPSGFTNYQWLPAYAISATSGANVFVHPSVDTAYVVRAEKSPGCFAYDTIRVTVYHSPSIYLGRDTSFCKGGSTSLDAGGGFDSYLWSSGQTSQTVSLNTAGRYSVIATNNLGCRSYDTIEIKNVWTLPVPALGSNPELCPGERRVLNPGSFSTYMWQDGSAAPTYTAQAVGKYHVTVTDVNNCVGKDTIDITTILPIPTGFLPLDTAICSYGKLILKTDQRFRDYAWSTGSRAAVITIEQPGFFWLEVSDEKGCKGRDSILVKAKDCMQGLFVPTAFTPNGDNKNDLFKAMLFGNLKKFELTVYNRWGQVVFQSGDVNQGWNGKVNSIEQPTGTFVWTCRYQLVGGVESFEKGNITLVR
jgi:gliding motility-associated-like protein